MISNFMSILQENLDSEEQEILDWLLKIQSADDEIRAVMENVKSDPMARTISPNKPTAQSTGEIALVDQDQENDDRTALLSIERGV